MAELLSLPPFRNALLALALTGAAFPLLGVAILSLELVGARFAVMHAALLGAALGLLAGFPALPAGLLGALAAGLGLAGLSERDKASAAGPMGLIMTLSLGLAFIVFHKAGGNSIEAFNLFWGSVLALGGGDLFLCAAASLLILALAWLFLREIRAVLYDRDLARAMGMPAVWTHRALIIVVCLGIGVAMRVTGALMTDAVTVLPALAARSLGRSLRGTFLWASVLGLAVNFSGFALSLALDLPVSPAIIVTGSALVLLCRGIEALFSAGGLRKPNGKGRGERARP